MVMHGKHSLVPRPPPAFFRIHEEKRAIKAGDEAMKNTEQGGLKWREIAPCKIEHELHLRQAVNAHHLVTSHNNKG